MIENKRTRPVNGRSGPVVGLATIIILALSGGCSTSQGYEFVRSAGEAKAECNRLLTASDQRECEARYARDYEEYEQQRRQVLSGEDAETKAHSADLN
jgi:hypothetical protein